MPSSPHKIWNWQDWPFCKKRPVKGKQLLRKNTQHDRRGEEWDTVFLQRKTISLISPCPLKVSLVWERPGGSVDTFWDPGKRLLGKCCLYLSVNKVQWLSYLESKCQSSNPCLAIIWLWAWSSIHSFWAFSLCQSLEVIALNKKGENLAPF